jgi:hypothetical protein
MVVGSRAGGASRLALVIGLLATSVGSWAQTPPSAAPAGHGSIVGKVLDAANARPIVGATVQILGPDGTSTRTDVDGGYTLYAPPGTYSVRMSAPLYGFTTVENIVVSTERSVTANASLKPRIGGGVEVVEVVADVTEATEATQLLKRKLAPHVGETLGAETISKTPDSDAAEVVTRLPAVTIKDDKFIVVRGLSERYSSALLNGSRLPSTDPNRRIVPLDLFPADFIESLRLIKTYTPDLPGDFAGGLIDIKLAEPARHLTYGMGVSMGINTETTFQP